MSQENEEKSPCLDVEIVKECNFPDDTNLNNKSNLNINNLNNLNNLTNINNLNNTSILTTPENKTEFVYFYLYDNGEKTGEQIIKAAQISSIDSFNTLRNRNKDKIIISRKQGSINHYDISQEIREQISLRIKQKQEQEKRKVEAMARDETIQKTQEEHLESIKTILEDKSLIKSENGFVWLNMRELQEQNPEIFDLFQNKPEETKDLIKNALEDKGLKNPLRFFNFTECFKPQSIDSIRSQDIDKILLVECRSSILTDVRPQITNIKFECPSCGTILKVLQIDKKIREPSRCSCGRRGGFKEVSKDLIDRARVEMEDLTDLTETPQIKSIMGFVKGYLTTAKELSKLNPGNEVKVLAILKTAEQHYAGGKSTALDIYLDILEVEPFEQIIDLSSFSEEEIKKYQEIAKTISEENDLRELRDSFSPDIIGNERPKDVLLLKSAQGRGRKNKSNTLFISNPGNAKSILAKKYNSIIPGTSYISGAGSSAVGLTATAEKKEEGWILKPGVLVTTKEDVIADEFNLIGDEEKPKLQEAMSEGQITINKASIHAKLKVSCGLVACANPINGIFDESQDLIKQFNIPPQILNRFDAVFIIKDSKEQKIDKAIAKQMLKRENNLIMQKHSDETLKRFFLYIRSQDEPGFSNELIENYIPQRYAEIRASMRITAEKRIINPRFIESVIRLSKAMAKIKLNIEVSKADVDFSIHLLKDTYLDWENISHEKQ